MSIEIHIAELRGFLNAAQQLCGPSHSFYAASIPAGADQDACLSAYFAGFEGGFNYQSSTPISYAQVCALLHEYIYSNLGSVNPQLLRELDWQLIEYYGLASTAVNGPFNPLVSEGALLLSVAQSHYRQCAYFAVRVPGHLIVTSLGIRA